MKLLNIILIILLASDSSAQENKKVVETKDYKFILKIQLASTSLLLEASSEYHYLPELSKLNTDTAILRIEITDDIADLQLTVVPNTLFDSIIVEQKFENALTLKNKEEGFEHLKKWWTVDTAWQPIIIDWPFKIIPYDTIREIKIKESLNTQFKQIKKEALKYKADDKYAPVIINASTITQLPLIVWASRYILRITIKTGDKYLVKYLIIEDELG